MSLLPPKPNTTIAYTDGACKNNPGAGGWGAYLIFADGSEQELYGGAAESTNNQMEMMATIQAILNSPAEHLLEIWTDSSYVKNGITKWVDNWKKNGWKTSGKKAVKNQELWQQLDELNESRNISWNWIKGHAGHVGNEKADDLANMGVIHPEGNATTETDKKKFIKSAMHSNEQSAHTAEQQTMTNNSLNRTSDTPNNDDWLYADPLGLGDFDDEYEGLDYEAEQCENSQESETELANTHLVTQGQGTVAEAEVVQQDNTFNTFDGDTSRANPNFRPLLPVPKYKDAPHRQLIMDTETTGLDPNNGDRIIEVGIVELVNRKFTGEKLHVYTNPKRSMDDEVIRIHGITDAFLADMPTFDKVAQQVYDFMDGAEIIAHNASFDIGFLNMEFAKVGLDDFAQRVNVTDTLAMAKQQYPGQKNTLDALVRRLNVGKQDRTFHGALLDSEILAEVYLAMTGGQVSLAIDDDSNDDGEVSHAQFSQLANLLLHSDLSNNGEHQQWLASISKKNAEVAQLWNYTP